MMLATSPMTRRRSSGGASAWLWGGILFLLVILGVSLFFFQSELRFEPHYSFVLSGMPFDFGHLPILPLLGFLGLWAFHGLTQRLFSPLGKPLYGASVLCASSVGMLVILMSPTWAVCQWSVLIGMTYMGLRWWQWRVATHAMPLSPWQWQDVVMGILFGLFGAFMGLFPLLLALGTLTLWFLNATRRRFSLRVWWENYRGVTVATVLSLLLSVLVHFSLTWQSSVFLPIQAMPHLLPTIQYLTLWGIGFVLIAFPWNGIVLYAGWNWWRNLSYRGKEDQLFDDRDGLLHQQALWWMLLSALMLVCSVLFHQDGSFLLLVAWGVMSWYGGHVIDRTASLLLPPQGLKRLWDLMPLFLLFLGVFGAWSILTQLPDTYLSEATWVLPGQPLAGDVKGDGTRFLGLMIPLWKLWLLTLPLWCIIGSASLASLQFITFSIYRSMSVFAGWSIVYTILLLAIQLPIIHPPFQAVHHRLLKPFALQPTPQNTVFQTLPPYSLSSKGSLHQQNVLRYRLATELDFYQSYASGSHHKPPVLVLLPIHYFGILPSSYGYYSLLDILPVFTYVGVHHYIVSLDLKDKP